MAMFTFEKDAGKKLFTVTPAKKYSSLSPSAAAALNDAATNAILTYLGAKHFPVTGLAVNYDVASATVTIKGLALDQATREKIIECCGNISGVQHVDDRMMLATDSGESPYHPIEEDNLLGNVAADMDGIASVHEAGLHGKPAPNITGRL